MFRLISILFEAFEGEEAITALSKVLKVPVKDILKAKNIKSKLKPGAILNVNHLRGKLPIKSFKNLLPETIFNNLNNLEKGQKKMIVKKWKDALKKDKSDEKTIDLMINFEGEIKLSSSFLQYGIFEIESSDSKFGRLTLAMSGKEYDFGKVKTTIWIAMVQAIGQNGTGAGSVLWNTLWYNKRTTTKVTGGVAGSLENLIKSKKRVYAQIARNAKLVNKFEGLRNSAKAQQIAKAQKVARKTRIKNKQRAQRRAR